MNDNELADRIVALGVGSRIDMEPPHSGHAYHIESTPTDWLILSDEFFVRDWRVAGALLEKVYDAYATLREVVEPYDGGDPRAISEACVEALT